jgi:hypothetical protein
VWTLAARPPKNSARVSLLRSLVIWCIRREFA